ncbi:hypothetical protein LEP1GSC151_2590 [Leptospira interrogans serovar Grippotyphosa str. LT2186]|uniref:Uncharacterized protein n=2 Tax=Leptospira interrogans TaxID=173 RepID=M3GRV3_LEPIR|nr:hypothetical protein LEP1GSC151_2590 [Leptospira interrogans serovar Grippotyphosa str. LT2186]EMY27246.1 hypothetical protein LEP1GSC115_3959 [Leptospira interrogans serovar Australis str. 200703203]
MSLNKVKNASDLFSKLFPRTILISEGEIGTTDSGPIPCFPGRIERILETIAFKVVKS